MIRVVRSDKDTRLRGARQDRRLSRQHLKPGDQSDDDENRSEHNAGRAAPVPERRGNRKQPEEHELRSEDIHQATNSPSISGNTGSSIAAMNKGRLIGAPKIDFAAVKPTAPCVKMVGIVYGSGYKTEMQKFND